MLVTYNEWLMKVKLRRLALGMQSGLLKKAKAIFAGDKGVLLTTNFHVDPYLSAEDEAAVAIRGG